MTEYKKRIIDMNRVKKLQENRMISPFFKPDKTKKKKEPIIRPEQTLIVPLTKSTKKVHIVNKPITQEKPKPSPPVRKTAYEIMREKAEQIRINWRKKREAREAKQVQPSSIPKRTNSPTRSKIEEIKEKWRKKGATID